MYQRPRITPAMSRAMIRLSEAGGAEGLWDARRRSNGSGAIDPRTVISLERASLARVAGKGDERRICLTPAGLAAVGASMAKPPEIGHCVPLYRTDTLSTDAWRARRSSYVGASEVAAVLGLSPYAGPLEVWATKTGRLDPGVDNAFTRQGRDMEPQILAWGEEVLGAPIERVPWVLSHPDSAALCCNLDGLVRVGGQPAVVEAKHLGGYGRSALREFRDTGAPPAGTALAAYWIQIQAQMAVTGLGRAYLVAYCDKDLEVIEVLQDPEAADIITNRIPAWWETYVIPDKEPPAKVAPDGKALARLYPVSRPEIPPVDLSEHTDTIERVRALRKEVKRLDAEQDALAAVLKAALGEAEVGEVDGRKVCTWKTQSRRYVDVTAWRKEDPDGAAQHLATSTSRGFRFTD